MIDPSRAFGFFPPFMTLQTSPFGGGAAGSPPTSNAGAAALAALVSPPGAGGGIPWPLLAAAAAQQNATAAALLQQHSQSQQIGMASQATDLSSTGSAKCSPSDSSAFDTTPASTAGKSSFLISSLIDDPQRRALQHALQQQLADATTTRSESRESNNSVIDNASHPGQAHQQRCSTPVIGMKRAMTSPLGGGLLCAQTNDDSDDGDDAGSNGGSASGGGKKPRKARTIFSDKQLQQLEESFEKQKYLSVQDRMELAQRLNLSDTQVKTWYQNRRTKWKRQTAVGMELLAEAGNYAAVQSLLRSNPYWASYMAAAGAMPPPAPPGHPGAGPSVGLRPGLMWPAPGAFGSLSAGPTDLAMSTAASSLPTAATLPVVPVPEHNNNSTPPPPPPSTTSESKQPLNEQSSPSPTASPTNADNSQ